MTFNLPSFGYRDGSIWDSFNRTPGIIENMLEGYTRSFPRIDVKEKGDQYIMEADLPGIDHKDIEVKVVAGTLIISGKREDHSEKKGTDYYINERFFGSFQRSIKLPTGVNGDEIDVSFKDGVLTIIVPKGANIDHGKKLKIKYKKSE